MSEPLIYHDEDFPMGLSCPECKRVLQEGEPFSSVLTGFNEDIPMTVLVCSSCALGTK